MRHSRALGSILFDVVNHLFMLFLIIAMIYPLMHVIALSLSRPDDIIAGLVNWFPRGFNTKGYELIGERPLFWISYRNTIAYAAAGTVLTLLLTSLMAFPLSIKNYQFKKPVAIFLTITIFFNGGLIPTYLLIRSLGLINTFAVMVIPGSVGAWSVFIFRTFFQGLPQDLRESAIIDGANEIMILFRIILPLSKALLATFALFTIVGHWNSWFSALIYLQDEKRYPLQMILRRINVQEDLGGHFESDNIIAWIKMRVIDPKNVQNASIIIAMVPILCIYPFIQRYFVKGVLIGAIKG